MDPSIVTSGDIAPIDAATKLGHHAADHAKKHNRDDDGIDDNVGIISPTAHATKQAWKGLIRGAASLGLFSGMFGLVKMVMNILMPEFEWASETLKLMVEGTAAGALSGAAWYGGQGAYQAYNDANEHNQNFMKRVQDKVRLRERMQSLGDMVPNFGIISADPGMVALQNGALLTEDGALLVPVEIDTEGNMSTPDAAAINVDGAADKIDRPEFLANILEQRQPDTSQKPSHVAALEAESAARPLESTR